MNQPIPRRIIQMDSRKDLPTLARAVAVNLQLLNPDYEYRFFDEAGMTSFIETEFPEFQTAMASFERPIQRYDLFRYLAIYRLGGFYFDTDVVLASPLENLRQSGCVFPFEHLGVSRFLIDSYDMDWEVGNYAFGAAPGHPFLRAIIDNCVRAQRDPRWAEAVLDSIPRMFRRERVVLAQTGPLLVSRTLAEYPRAREEVTVLFPDDVCDQSKWYCFGDYGVHLQQGAWRRREPLIRRVLHRHWEANVRKSLIRKSLERGNRRTLQFGTMAAGIAVPLQA